MAGFPVTINGNTYTQEQFDGYNYVANFPAIIADIATVSGNIDGDLSQVMAALAQAQVLYAAMQSTPLGVVAQTGSSGLSKAMHQQKLVVVSGSGAVNVAWGDTGEGFFALVANRKALPLPVSVTSATLIHPDGHTRIRTNGMAALVGFAGAPNQIQLIGQTEP